MEKKKKKSTKKRKKGKEKGKGDGVRGEEVERKDGGHLRRHLDGKNQEGWRKNIVKSCLCFPFRASSRSAVFAHSDMNRRESAHLVD